MSCMGGHMAAIPYHVCVEAWMHATWLRTDAHGYPTHPAVRHVERPATQSYIKKGLVVFILDPRRVLVETLAT